MTEGSNLRMAIPGPRHIPQRWLYNLFIERPRRSLNYEDICLAG
jgi:hypothetical protein